MWASSRKPSIGYTLDARGCRRSRLPGMSREAVAAADRGGGQALSVSRGGSGNAHWELTMGRCHPALAPYVREYCGYVERTEGPKRRREMPGAQVVMIIDFGPTLRLLDGTGERLVARHPGGFV